MNASNRQVPHVYAVDTQARLKSGRSRLYNYIWPYVGKVATIKHISTQDLHPKYLLLFEDNAQIWVYRSNLQEV